MSAPRPAARFSVDIPPELLQVMTGGGNIAPRISRDEALQVPAVLRARNLICGSLGTLPIRVHGPDRRTVTDTTYLVPQPDPDIAPSVTMAMTYEDLFFESVAWWRVTKWGWHGYPIEGRHIPVGSVHVAPTGSLLPSQSQVSPDEPFPVDGQVYIDGRPVGDHEVIRFDSPNPPLLRHAARAIRTCLLLDSTAALYAKDPQPLAFFTPAEGAEQLTDDEIQDELDKWEAARSQRATGYLNAALKWNTAGWSPEQLQLADARQHAVLQIAIAAGVDPEDLGVSTTSRTYANREQANQDRINMTLGAYVSAVQERLSMRDVLPRGYNAEIDFAGFLRGDSLTRNQSYEIGLRTGAWTREEIRVAENKPPLTAAQLASGQPATPATQPPMPQSPEVQQVANTQDSVVRFGSTEPARIRFDTPEVAASFQVDTQKRTIIGLAVPWNKVARSGFSNWRFAPDSLRWADPSRVKLNLDHTTELIGVATRLQSSAKGLMATFRIANTPEGDKALALADDGVLDGMSIEVDFSNEMGDTWQTDPSDESVRLVTQGSLRGVALTGMPAFDDARLTAVHATREGVTMGEKIATDPPGATFDFDGYMSTLADKITSSHQNLTQQLGESIGESISAGFKVALDNMPSPQGGPGSVRAARFTVTREEPVYTFNGYGNSLVRDAWYAARERDQDSLERLRKYRVQTEEVAKLAQTQLGAQFSTTSTSSVSQVIPPGYRPDLYVTQLQQGRPMVNACSQGTIANATPFVVPVFGSVSGATGDHTEGVNPTDGTLTFATKTVTPGAIDGKMVLTREIVDSSNPVIDQIALASMRESYNRQTEGKVFTLLNGSNGAGGTITSGFVPSGAQSIQSASGAATALPVDIRKALALYPFRRFNSPTIGLMSQVATSALASAVGTDNRPLFPSVGAMNASGIGNAVNQGWYVDGLAFVPAWAMSGVVGATDTHVFILNQADAWVWESPTLMFRFEEKSGPALIELALFGYFATHCLRPVGLSGIRMTAP